MTGEPNDQASITQLAIPFNPNILSEVILGGIK
jgi:hypothetical protein